MKKCTKCKVDKSPTEFRKNKSEKDGLSRYCKLCLKLYNQNRDRFKNYTPEQIEAYKQSQKLYQSVHLRRITDAKKAKRNKRQEWLLELKKHLKCERCGFSHPAVLDFHHKNPMEKDMDVSKAVGKNWKEERFLAEIAKCEVLCANCHRIHHYDERIG